MWRPPAVQGCVVDVSDSSTASGQRRRPWVSCLYFVSASRAPIDPDRCWGHIYADCRREDGNIEVTELVESKTPPEWLDRTHQFRSFRTEAVFTANNPRLICWHNWKHGIIHDSVQLNPPKQQNVTNTTSYTLIMQWHLTTFGRERRWAYSIRIPREHHRTGQWKHWSDWSRRAWVRETRTGIGLVSRADHPQTNRGAFWICCQSTSDRGPPPSPSAPAPSPTDDTTPGAGWVALRAAASRGSLRIDQFLVLLLSRGGETEFASSQAAVRPTDRSTTPRSLISAVPGEHAAADRLGRRPPCGDVGAAGPHGMSRNLWIRRLQYNHPTYHLFFLHDWLMTLLSCCCSQDPIQQCAVHTVSIRTTRTFAAVRLYSHKPVDYSYASDTCKNKGLHLRLKNWGQPHLADC